MSSSSQNPTQGSKLANFYGAETATMYAGMMEEEMDKYKGDFELIFEILQKEFSSESDKAKTTIRILDTCCGSCHMLKYIDENLSKGDNSSDFELIGMDLSEDMIKMGKAIAPSAALKVGNMLDVSQETDSSYHLILNNFAMHHALPGQAKQAIVDYARLLVLGGILFFSAWEGEGKIDYGDMDMEALFHNEDTIKSWIDAAGLTTLMCRTFVEKEMGDMNSTYIIAQKRQYSKK